MNKSNKIKKEILNSYIFDNGKEYLLKIKSKHKNIMNEFMFVATLFVDNIKDYYAYAYADQSNKGTRRDRTTVNLHNPIDGETGFECFILYSDLEFLINRIKNMNKRRYKKYKKDYTVKIKSRSEILEIE